MYKDVVIKSFEKAEKEIHGKTTTNNISEHISNSLLDDFQHQLSGRRLRTFYKDSLSDTENDISIYSSHINALANYLGYKDYEDFLRSNISHNEGKEKNKLTNLLKDNKIGLIIGTTVLLLVYFLNTFNKQRWMTWQKTEYVEVDFDARKYSKGILKLYDSNIIDNLRKIEADCETKIFDENKEAVLWYGKNKVGEYEFFNDVGKHPETGKTLKAVTPYMFKKYICPD
ncbi:hypothetical protein [Seonamhaeicola sp. ML3]|uniref:hypothetical protein n=1 Tax=Seonamhaeicola sp. ML3 TaxID=2937786 RepID=UPI00200EB554|nr:hypothetical protein [Seonamhaeicola sp. ML3]